MIPGSETERMYKEIYGVGTTSNTNHLQIIDQYLVKLEMRYQCSAETAGPGTCFHVYVKKTKSPPVIKSKYAICIKLVFISL